MDEPDATAPPAEEEAEAEAEAEPDMEREDEDEPEETWACEALRMPQVTDWQAVCPVRSLG